MILYAPTSGMPHYTIRHATLCILWNRRRCRGITTATLAAVYWIRNRQPMIGTCRSNKRNLPQLSARNEHLLPATTSSTTFWKILQPFSLRAFSPAVRMRLPQLFCRAFQQHERKRRPIPHATRKWCPPHKLRITCLQATLPALPGT